MPKKNNRKGKSNGGKAAARLKRRVAKGSAKWLDGLEPDMPADAAARLVLRARLKAVERALPPACDDWRDDPELVHRLRVCTRRAGAALRAFESRVDGESARRVHKRLKKLRRAATDARASDVLAIAFVHRRADAPASQQSFIEDLLAWNDAMRETAQRRLGKTRRRHPLPEMRRDRKRLIRSTRGRDAPPRSLGSLARDVLGSLGRELGRDARAVCDLSSLHRLRLSTKRLRYGLEIFRCCLGAGFADVYGQITAMQEQLGAINDAGEFADTVETFASSHGDDRDEAWRTAAREIEADLRRQVDEGVERFLDDWRRGRWTSLIERVAGDATVSGERRVDPAPVELHGVSRSGQHDEAYP